MPNLASMSMYFVVSKGYINWWNNGRNPSFAMGYTDSIQQFNTREIQIMQHWRPWFIFTSFYRFTNNCIFPISSKVKLFTSFVRKLKWKQCVSVICKCLLTGKSILKFKMISILSISPYEKFCSCKNPDFLRQTYVSCRKISKINVSTIICKL